MNILLYRYGNICESGVLDAAKYLKHNILEIDNEISNKKITPGERITLLNNVLKSFAADVIFSINYYPEISELCKIYGMVYCSLVVDSPVFELYSDTVTNACNRIFTFDGAMISNIPTLHNANIVSVPLCSDYEKFNSVCENTADKLKNKYGADISFVGTLYSDKCLYNSIKHKLPEYIRGYIDGIVEAQLKIYGYNFTRDMVAEEMAGYFKEHFEELYHFPEKSVKDYRAVVADDIIGMKVAEQERIRLLRNLSNEFSVNLYTSSDTLDLPNVNNCGVVKTYSEMPLVFNQSRINLNITAKTIRTGLPLRVFDVLACGGFLITNYQEQLSECFEAGTDLEIYSSEEELFDKIRFYLKNDNIRQKIAQNGREKVKNNHTYRIRMEQILNSI